MAYDEDLADRLRLLSTRWPGATEKKMFGGLAFMLDGHMFCGIIGDNLMARVGPVAYEAALKRPHTRLMDFTGKPLRGFVLVRPEGYASEAALMAWVDGCAQFVSSLAPKDPSAQKHRHKKQK